MPVEAGGRHGSVREGARRLIYVGLGYARAGALVEQREGAVGPLARLTARSWPRSEAAGSLSSLTSSAEARVLHPPAVQARASGVGALHGAEVGEQRPGQK